jgi:hypothetical protein
MALDTSEGNSVPGATRLPALAGSPSAATVGSATLSIVLLTYKSPKSLAATLQSLGESGVLGHPAVREVIVFVQVRQAADDEGVARAMKGAGRAMSDDAVVPPYRVLGDSKNYPVAEATFKAIGAATTSHILYLECDRPAYPFRVPGNARAIIDTALGFLVRETASVFRLQLYDTGALGPRANELLPDNTYGRDTHDRCLASPTFASDGTCATAKKTKGPVFNTAYCKHWRKYAAGPEKGKQDLCDSFCFATWTTSRGSSFVKARAGSKAKFDRVTLYASNGTALGPATAAGEAGQAKDAAAVAAAEVLCLSSEECNWTNQPTMYSKAWYERAIVAPCLADRRGCVGAPGRRSAVLQEQFFLKAKSGWAAARHPVCLHRDGLFFHNEVDNRE